MDLRASVCGASVCGERAEVGRGKKRIIMKKKREIHEERAMEKEKPGKLLLLRYELGTVAGAGKSDWCE